MDEPILLDNRKTSVLDAIMEVSNAIAIYTNDHTKDFGHYRIIANTTANKREDITKKIEKVLTQIYDDETKYNMMWGKPTTDPQKRGNTNDNATIAKYRRHQRETKLETK